MTKSILITGAHTGIGRATAEFLASHGFLVYAGVRSYEAMHDLENISNKTPLQLDVTNPSDIEEMKKIIEENGIGLYGVVNNAGIAKAGPLMDISVEDLRTQFEVNLFGIHQVTQAVFSFILQSKGRIVMMSSDSGFFATPFFGPYCASKFALEGYSDSLRREILPYDVKVILIEPGRINTPIWDKGQEFLTKYPGSLFAKEAFAIGEHAIHRGKTVGLPPIEVAKAVYVALTVPKPKLRYLVASNTAEYKLMKILPTGYVDKLAVNKVQNVVKLFEKNKEKK
jgi:NAD(P)-dependent dehydrogenase (short-subunit alcohol dehydrogenase family)